MEIVNLGTVSYLVASHAMHYGMLLMAMLMVQIIYPVLSDVLA